MKRFDAYLPIDRRRSMAAGHALPERAEGAVLFADVSGFTPLTETLVRELGRRRGAEELTQHLNRVYGALIHEVHAQRGCVIGFSGDAITCFFEGDQGRRALSAAIAMQQVVGRQAAIETPSGYTVALGVKAAVAAGPVRRLLVGDPEVRLLDVLAGAPLDRMAAGEGLASEGEVIAGPAVMERLGRDLSLAELRRDGEGRSYGVVAVFASVAADPWPEIEAEPLDAARVRPFLLPEVYERLLSGQGHFLAELRFAIALFVSFAGLDYDRDDQVGGKLDRWIRWVDQLLRRYGGSLIDLTSGDKGSYFYAVFGAPVAHEDDAERAAAAALQLMRPPADLSFVRDLRIGISRGRLRAGETGSVTRRTYSVLGDETNVAARLMSRAEPGQILISGRIAEALADRFHLLDLGHFKAKGKREPMPIFELRPDRRSASRAIEAAADGAIVGRQKERGVLREALARLLRGQAGVVVVEGEAGIGKSRLLQELLRGCRTAEEPLEVHVGIADAVESATAYFVWRSIFTTLLGAEHSGDLSPAAIDSWLSARLDDRQAQLGPLLGPLLALDLPDNEFTSQLSGQVRADNTHRLLRAIVEQAAALRPRLLVLDDLHWADSASWALIAQLARSPGRWLLVLATRPMGDAAPSELRQQIESGEHLLLGSMSRQESLLLVCRRLGVSGLPEPVARLISDKAEGNPFFSEELANALRDADLIRIDDGHCKLAPGVTDLAQTQFPDTIEGVVTGRIDRLRPEQQLTVKVASVLGRVFFHQPLYEVYPSVETRHLLRASLDCLQRLDLTHLETPEPDLSYIFKHAITQEVAYNMMLFAQRRELHQRVAEWYEAHHEAGAAGIYPLLAHHWTKTLEEVRQPPQELVAKAVACLEQAAAEALRNFANPEAAGFFEQILEFEERLSLGASTTSPSKKSEWHGGAGQAFFGLGRLAKAKEHYHAAIELLGERVAEGKGSRVLALFGQLGRQLVHRLRPGGAVVPRSQARREDLLQLAGHYHDLAEVAYLNTESLAAFHCGFSCLNAAERAANSAERLAVGYSTICTLVGMLSLHRLAELYRRLADRMASKVDHQTTQAQVQLMIGLYKVGVGQWQEVRLRLDKGQRIFQRLGAHRLWGDTASVLAASLILEGSQRRAVELCESLYETFQRLDNRLRRAWSRNYLAVATLRSGDAQAAAEFCEEVISLAADSPDGWTQVIAHGQLALARWQLGQLDAARAAAEVAREHIARTSPPTVFSTLWGYQGCAEVYLELWAEAVANAAPERAELGQRVREMAGRLRTFSWVFPIGRPAARLFAGRVAWLGGRQRRALRLLRRSLVEAEELKMPFEQARAHAELGRRLSADGSRRAYHLDAARRIFAELGAAGELSALDALAG